MSTMTGSAWCAMHNVQTFSKNKKASKAVLFKAVNKDFVSAQSQQAKNYRTANRLKAPYAVGAELTAPDWQDNGQCGNGLHLSPTPAAAKNHAATATKIMACIVKVKDIRVLVGSGNSAKCKVKTLKVHSDVTDQCLTMSNTYASMSTTARGKTRTRNPKVGEEVYQKTRYARWTSSGNTFHKVLEVTPTHITVEAAPYATTKRSKMTWAHFNRNYINAGRPSAESKKAAARVAVPKVTV